MTDRLIHSIMETRYQSLELAFRGFQQTGIPLVASDGKSLLPAAFSDDIGMYYFVPKIAQIFHLSLNQAINVFFLSIIAVSLVLGYLGFYLLCKSWPTRIISWLGITLLAAQAFIVYDVYLLMAMLPIAIVPLFIVGIRAKKVSWWWFVFLFISGLVIGAGHMIRSHAATALILFILVFVYFAKQLSIKQKFFASGILIVGFLCTILFFSNLMHKRDAYLVEHQPGYTNIALGKHVFWHSVYIGLGYIDNDLKIHYSDQVAIDKVKEVSPNTAYLSTEYESILKRETLSAMASHRVYMLSLISAKIGVIVMFFIVFANLGILARFKRKPPFSWDLAFYIALAFSALNGLLVIPSINYLIGFIAFATLYGIIGIDFYLDKDRLVSAE